MQIQSNCMLYSIFILKFAKRAHITFGAFAKGNLLPFGIYEHKQKDYFFNDHVAIPEYFSAALSLLNLLENNLGHSKLDSCKHNNTLCGIFILYSSITEQPSIEIK